MKLDIIKPKIVFCSQLNTHSNRFIMKGFSGLYSKAIHSNITFTTDQMSHLIFQQFVQLP